MNVMQFLYIYKQNNWLQQKIEINLNKNKKCLNKKKQKMCFSLNKNNLADMKIDETKRNNINLNIFADKIFRKCKKLETNNFYFFN